MITVDIDALAAAIVDRLPTASRWMKVSEAAEYIRVSERTLRGLLHEIPHSKIEGRILIDRADLDEYVTNHRR